MKKRNLWMGLILIVVLLSVGAGLFVVMGGNSRDDALYFPLKTDNHWVYKVTLPDNTNYRQDLVVLAPDGNNLKLQVVVNGSPYAEISYQVGDKGLLKLKQISPNGINQYEPGQLGLGSDLSVGASWEWKAKDSKMWLKARVVKAEKVTVMAGTFDTILVRTEGLGEDGKLYTDDTWYAKGVGYVKSVRTSEGKTQTEELTVYKLAESK